MQQSPGNLDCFIIHVLHSWLHPDVGACNDGDEAIKMGLVELQEVCFSYQGRKVLEQVNMRAHAGRITAIMGPSGAGKTTLLKLMTGQLKPDQGTVHVEDQCVHVLGRTELYKLRKKMGMLFQGGALLTDLNVFDNVAYPIREHAGLDESRVRVVVREKLDAVGLGNAAGMMPAELSGGMARRVALARAIALDPDIVFYDEPFTGQDPITRGVLVKLIREINQKFGITSVIVSHDVQETFSIADNIFLLVGGKVIDQGSAEELLASANESTRQFLQGLPAGPLNFDHPELLSPSV